MRPRTADSTASAARAPLSRLAVPGCCLIMAALLAVSPVPGAAADGAAVRSIAVTGMDTSQFPLIRLQIQVIEDGRAVLNLRPQDFSLQLDGQPLVHSSGPAAGQPALGKPGGFVFQDLGEAYAFQLTAPDAGQPETVRVIALSYGQGASARVTNITFSQALGLIGTEGGGPPPGAAGRATLPLQILPLAILALGLAAGGGWLAVRQWRRRKRQQPLAEFVEQALSGLGEPGRTAGRGLATGPVRDPAARHAGSPAASGHCPRCRRPFEETFDYCIYCESETDGTDAPPAAGGGPADMAAADDLERRLLAEEWAGQQQGKGRQPPPAAAAPEPLAIQSDSMNLPQPREAEDQGASPFDIVAHEPTGEVPVFRRAAVPAAPAAGPDLDSTPIFQEQQLLCVEREGALAATYELVKDRKYLIGSNPVADIVVNDPQVGPIQARLVFRNGQFHIRNLNPSVPLLVNGVDAEHSQMTSSHRIRVGETELFLKVELRRVN